MNVNPLASTTENKENATNTNETNSGVNPLPNGLPLSIFCQSKEADPVKERALFEKWRQRNVEDMDLAAVLALGQRGSWLVGTASAGLFRVH